MKFRAEPKDIAIFCGFCIFLLYMCAVGVLNANSLATEGRLYGIVPFKAFTSEFIGSTFTLFLLALVGIFTAVSSYFFDREKGLMACYMKRIFNNRGYYNDILKKYC